MSSEVILNFTIRRGYGDCCRPIGSQEYYYVESWVDDGSVSVAMSETTVESTHAGDYTMFQCAQMCHKHAFVKLKVQEQPSFFYEALIRLKSFEP